MTRLERLRSLALDSILEQQKDDGEIPSLEFYPFLEERKDLGWHYRYPSPFIHSCTMMSLLDVREEKAETILKKGTTWLLNRRKPHDLWRFWDGKNIENPVPYDVDDTSVCSFVLESRGHRTKGYKILEHYIAVHGEAQTWILPKKHLFPKFPLTYLQLKRIEGTYQHVIAEGMLSPDDQEPSIMANVLTYLALHKSQLAEVVASKVIDGWYDPNASFQFYENRLILAYHSARAYSNGIEELAKIKYDCLEFIEKSLGRLQLEQRLLAVLTMKFFGFEERAKSVLLQVLGDLEEPYVWKPFGYFTSKNRMFFAGSAALTAAWFLEASNMMNDQQSYRDSKVS